MATNPRSVAPTPPRPAPPPAPPESRLLVAAGALVDTRTMPTLAGGAEVSAGWTYASRPVRARLFATGTYLAQANRAIQTATGAARADFDLFAASGRACIGFVAAPFDVGPCLGAELGVMTASNVQAPADAAHGATAFWWSVLGSALARVEVLRSFGVFVRADGVVPIQPPSFAIRAAPPNENTTSRVVLTPAVSFRTTLGVEAHFF